MVEESLIRGADGNGISRRDLLKAGVAAAAATEVLRAQDGTPTTFSDPTVRFSAERSVELPPWAFQHRALPVPLVPRPTFVGSYEQLCGSGQAFGPGDYRPVGDVFHGIASEWGQTPQHWKAWGCDPSLQGAAAWKDKQKHFGSWPDRIDLKKLAKCFESPQSGGVALENPWDYAAAGAQKICNWGQFPIKVYKVPIREVFRQLRPDAPFPARMYGYAGMVPGPMLKMRLGQPVVVRYENHLDAEVSVHLHGGHSPSHSDGFPSFYVLQGKARDYFYPNILPLHESQHQPEADGGSRYYPDMGESQSTMWYHDHGMDATGYNVSKGLAGVAPCFGDIELELIRQNILPGLGEKSCTDPERDCLHTDPAMIAKLEDPDHPGFYRHAEGCEPYYNPYDIPLVLQDKVVDTKTGQIAFDTSGHNGYLGDTMFVNGAAWPHLHCESRKYRFRLLDGSNSRVFSLRILSERDFLEAHEQGIDAVQPSLSEAAAIADRGRQYDAVSKEFLRIGKDSWLWSQAVNCRKVTLAMANRADIVVDFEALTAGLQEGEEAVFYLCNTMQQFDGRGPHMKLAPDGTALVLPLPFDTAGTADGLVSATRMAEASRPQGLLKFIVKKQKLSFPNASVAHGTRLVPHQHPISDEEVKVVREFIFQRGRGAWMINSRFYDPTIANATPELGTAEEWVLRNGGGGWWHPIHIHLESHQLVSYEKDFAADAFVDAADAPVQVPSSNLVDVTSQLHPVELRGLHDTQVLGPNTVARIRMRFRTWRGPFVFHCHNLEHEDMRMMYNFEPVPQSEPAQPTDSPNTVPNRRTHGDDVTLQPPSAGISGSRKIGELPFEPLPVPRAPTSDAGTLQIPPADVR